MQYNDAWRVHIRASRFACAPCMGSEKVLWNHRESGTSRWLYDAQGEVKKKGVHIRTFTRGGYGNMYPSSMR